MVIKVLIVIDFVKCESHDLPTKQISGIFSVLSLIIKTIVDKKRTVHLINRLMLIILKNWGILLNY